MNGTNLTRVGQKFERLLSRLYACRTDAVREADYLRVVSSGQHAVAPPTMEARRRISEQVCSLVDKALAIQASDVADLMTQYRMSLFAIGINERDFDRPDSELDWDEECAKKMLAQIRRLAAAASLEAKVFT